MGFILSCFYWQMYINCPGGSTYSVLAIYDCMSWVRWRFCHPHFALIHTKFYNLPFHSFASYFNSLIVICECYTLNAFLVTSFFQIKPKVGTVCFGVAASQATLLLAGGEKGMRYSMPNSRIMMSQPQCGFGVRINLLKFCYRRCT